MFFVMTENLNKSDSKSKDSSIVRQSSSKAPKQYQKDMDGIKIQLKELYDEKEERKLKLLEREKRQKKRGDQGFDGFDKGYGSSPSENYKEEEIERANSFEERYQRYQRNFNLKQYGQENGDALLPIGGNTPKQMQLIHKNLSKGMRNIIYDNMSEDNGVMQRKYTYEDLNRDENDSLGAEQMQVIGE